MNFSLLLPLLLGLIPMLCLGIEYVANAKVSRQVGPLKAVFLFQLLGLPLLILLLPLETHKIDINILYPLALGVVFTFVLLLSFYAIKIGNVSITGPICQTSGFMTFVFGILLLHETLGVLKLASGLLVLGGVILLAVNFKDLKKVNLEMFYKGVPHALVFAVGAGLFMVASAAITREVGWITTSLAIKIAIALTTFVLLITRKNRVSEIFRGIPWKIAILTATLDVISFSTYNFAATKFEVSYLAVFASAASLVVIAIASVFLKEKISSVQKIGVLLTVLGLIGIQFRA